MIETKGPAKDSITPNKRAEVLIEALPYLREFYGKTIVIKYGGNAMIDEQLKEDVMKDVALLQYVGIRPVLVHGGGPEITTWLDKLKISSTFNNGLRVTDEETMEVVEMALAGKTNKNLVALLNQNGAKGVGLSGKDANLLVARKLEPDGVDLGLVGEVIQVNAQFLSMLSDQGYVPVICSVAIGQDGKTYNVNADHAAGAIAVALGATKLMILTDTAGLLEDKDDPATVLSRIDTRSALDMISAGKAERGMIPKLEACVAAVQSGVERAHIIDGRQSHSMLVEVFTDAGVGTMIVPPDPWRTTENFHLAGGFQS